MTTIPAGARIYRACGAIDNIEPKADLRDVLTRIGGHPINRLYELLPWNLPTPAAVKRDVPQSWADVTSVSVLDRNPRSNTSAAITPGPTMIGVTTKSP
jgi:hypothetical protein